MTSHCSLGSGHAEQKAAVPLTVAVLPIDPGWCLGFAGSRIQTTSPHRRNPDGDVQPWCYVAETEEGIYWRYCDIPTCHSEWAQPDKGGSAGPPEWSFLSEALDRP